MKDLIWFDEPLDHDAGGKVRATLPSHVISEAIYSPCRQYRYLLHRRWEPDQPDRSIMFIMANPSTATEEVDDPTVRKCRFYAMRWDYNHMIVGNVMAYRATDPSLLRGVEDPVGPENIKHLRDAIAAYTPMIVCAWGSIPARLVGVDRSVQQMLRELEVKPHILRLNSSGTPSHPLYLPMDLQPQVWNIDRHAI